MEFKPSEHAFPFPNCWAPGTPVIEVPTPFGTIRIGDASLGVCGGMVFAACDYFHHRRPVPREPEKPVFHYFTRRLFNSWNLPFGALKYYDWQLRPTGSKFASGVKLVNGTFFLTATVEWPILRAGLDAGRLEPLNLQKTTGFSPFKLGHNHQVLAYKYQQHGNDVTIWIYDPNYANNDDVTLTFNLDNPDEPKMITHSCEGPNIRGIFHNEYSPKEPVEG